jgi:POT family proton-dependent oligopeptide transporter
MNLIIILGVVVTVVTGLPVLMQLLKTHPRGLMILFFAEMWERFSYYGMRGLLIFYLTQHFLFDDAFAGGQYGSYASLVYLLPLVGGLLADRILGTRKAVAFGALLLVAGHFTMAYEGRPTTQSLSYGGTEYQVIAEGRGDARTAQIEVAGQRYDFGPGENGALAIEGLPAGGVLPAVLPQGSYELETNRDPIGVGVFYLALALIIMGVGYLKPNISTMVGQLYPQGDPRRDPGFTLYYYGINLGSFWAAVLCGYLGQTVGWWAGFGLAGVGMLLGYVVFVLGRPLLQGVGEPPNPARLAEKVGGFLSREWLIYLLTIPGILAIWFVVQRHTVVGWVLSLSTLAALAYVAYFIVAKCDRIARERMMLAMTLIFGAVIFFTLFEQAASSLNLFADRNTDLNITKEATRFLGIPVGTPEQMAAAGIPTDGFWIDSTMTAAQTQSFNAGFILIFAPLFAALWTWLGRIGKDPGPMVKFGLGLAQVGLGFLVVVWGVELGLVNEAFRTPLIMLALLYLLHTTGELFLSPVGLSEITKLSVASIVAFMMAVWFLASSIAHFVGGIIAGMAGTETVGGQVVDPSAALQTSLEMFNVIGWAGVGFGLLYLLLAPVMNKWGHGHADPQANPSHLTDRGTEM